MVERLANLLLNQSPVGLRNQNGRYRDNAIGISGTVVVVVLSIVAARCSRRSSSRSSSSSSTVAHAKGPWLSDVIAHDTGDRPHVLGHSRHLGKGSTTPSLKIQHKGLLML